MENPELSSVHQRSGRQLPPLPRAAPWLVYEHGKNCKFQTFYNISDPVNISYRKDIPELTLSPRQFWQKSCHQGWLVILRYGSEYGECFLWNPASLETIQLPNFLDCLTVKHDVIDCLLSSPPQTSSNTNGSSNSSGGGDEDGGTTGGCNSSTDNSMVYILFNGGKKPDVTLIYCHPGEKEWRKHEFVNVDDRDLKEMLFFKGKLYIMCWRGDDLEIEIQQGSGNEETLSISDFSTGFESSKYDHLVAGELVSRFEQHWIAYLDEIFTIEILYIPRGIYQNSVTGVEIRKLDFPTMTWEEVKSLDEYVFFISGNVQLCCLASELGLSKGCVYFTQKEEMSLYKYDLEDDSILFCLPCPDLPKQWLNLTPPKWLMISTTDHMFREGSNIEQVIKEIECNSSTVTGDKDDGKEKIEEAWVVILNDDDDMVWLISNYLHTLDYIHLRAVSKKYRSILKLKRSSSTRTTTIQTADISPWMVLAKYDQQVFSFVNPMHKNESYLINIPELLKGTRIRFSKGGWLLMSKDESLFFYNPFNKLIIQLPDLLDNYSFSGISFSSLPTSPDCVVFAVDKRIGETLEISFIKRGDGSWTDEEFDHISLPTKRKNLEFELSFNNPVFHKGAFYCLGINGTLGVSKFVHDIISWEVLTSPAPPKCKFIYKSFMLECEGKLLAVLLGHLGNWVRVFRLDDTDMIWDEVKNLGKHMLFLSNTSSFSAIAPTGRQMENRIYFPRLHNEGILFYSMDTGMYHSIGSSHAAKDYRGSKESLHCSWIEPNWSETSSGDYLDWLNI